MKEDFEHWQKFKTGTSGLFWFKPKFVLDDCGMAYLNYNFALNLYPGA
jgi:hypothetical protein